MRYEYIANNLEFFVQDAIHNREHGVLLRDSSDELYYRDIVEDAAYELTKYLKLPEDSIFVGRAKVTIELLSDLEAKSEFTQLDCGKWGEPLPVNMMEEMD